MMKLLYILIVNVYSYAEEIFDLGTDSFSSSDEICLTWSQIDVDDGH